jgi:hypothetical protein
MKRAELEALKTQVDQLDPYEQQQLFLIIKNYTQDFTRTDSGVLVQASVLSKKCLEEMKIYTQFCLDQKRRMEEDNVERQTYERLMT